MNVPSENNISKKAEKTPRGLNKKCYTGGMAVYKTKLVKKKKLPTERWLLFGKAR